MSIKINVFQTRRINYLLRGESMKKLLKKLFYVDSPEKGAFLGIVLLLFGSWLVGTFFVLSVSGHMMMYNAVTGKFTPEGICLLAAPSAAVRRIYLPAQFRHQAALLDSTMSMRRILGKPD